MTFCNLSSKSPRYLVPAKRPVKSNCMMRLPCRKLGPFPSAILCASPSAIAVLPTPGSPIRTGLFLRRRAKTWTARLISFSRPMTTSSSPASAIFVRSRAYCSSVAVLDLPLLAPPEEETAPTRGLSWLFTASKTSVRTLAGSTLSFLRIFAASPSSSLMSARRMWTVSTAFDPNFSASSTQPSRTSLASFATGMSTPVIPFPLPTNSSTTLRISSSFTPSFASTFAATPLF
mmetsp:Transcript_154073/g.287178  ORF Transcript_154073/g.287178 Transcript_154073/m.287178 type:complete len:232 (+) Transcript_154073:1732-2427(+)